MNEKVDNRTTLSVGVPPNQLCLQPPNLDPMQILVTPSNTGYGSAECAQLTIPRTMMLIRHA